MYRNLEIFSSNFGRILAIENLKKKALNFSTFNFKFNLCFWLFLLPGMSSSASSSSSSSTHMTSVCCSFLLLFPLRFHVVAFCYLVLNSQQLTLHNNNNKICGTRTAYCSRRAKDLQQLELADRIL